MQASIHSHEPLFPVNHWIPFYLLSILLAVLFDAFVTIPSHVHLSSTYTSYPYLQPLLEANVLSMLSVVELESVVVVSFTCTSMIAGLLLINNLLNVCGNNLC